MAGSAHGGQDLGPCSYPKGWTLNILNSSSSYRYTFYVHSCMMPPPAKRRHTSLSLYIYIYYHLFLHFLINIFNYESSIKITWCLSKDKVDPVAHAQEATRLTERSRHRSASEDANADRLDACVQTVAPKDWEDALIVVRLRMRRRSKALHLSLLTIEHSAVLRRR